MGATYRSIKSFQVAYCLINYRFVFNDALLHSLSRLINPTPALSFTGQVLYWRSDQVPMAWMKEFYRKQIIDLGEGDCREHNDNGFINVEWSKKGG